MSMTEQKFDSLCTLAEKLKDIYTISIDSVWPFIISINPKFGDLDRIKVESNDIDQALTDALRYLRKIKTKHT